MDVGAGDVNVMIGDDAVADNVQLVASAYMAAVVEKSQCGMALSTSQINHVWSDRARGKWADTMGDVQHHEPLNRRITWRPVLAPMSRSAAVNLVNAMHRQ